MNWELGIGRKSPKTDIGVDVNKLNDQFVNSKIPTSIGNLYNVRYGNLSYLCYVPPQHSFSFCCVNYLEVLERITAVKSNEVGFDDLDRLFLKALTPKLFPTILIYSKHF